jgi:hypothetical protein
MMKLIYDKVFGGYGTSRKAQRRNGPRRLAIENLEARKLLTVATPTAATLTLNSVSDGSFAAPALAARSFQVDPGSTPWQYSGDAGVSTNSSAFTGGNPAAPNGTQVGFIKDNGSITQAVYLQAGVYNLSLLAAQRANYQTQPQEIEVLVDGADDGLIVPAGTTYAQYQSNNFAVSTGTHTVELLGMNPPVADSTAFVDTIAITPVDDSLIDGGFEQPALASQTSVSNPSGSPWVFNSTTGIAANASSFVASSSEAQNAPAGTQVAYIQDTGDISQTVYLDAGTYQVSFQAAQRAINQTNYQDIEVLVDGVNYGTIEPATTAYSLCQSSTFTVAAGSHTIELLGTNPEGGDNTALVDQVTLAAANGFSDGSFETPALDNAQYQYTPDGSSWTFLGGAGISSNGSSFTSGNPHAPDGTQVAFINGAGDISQAVDLAAGSYGISFQAAQWSGDADTQGEQIQVLVDGAQVGLITPASTSYSLYDTSNFYVAAGMHTVQLVGMVPEGGNNMALIDLASVSSSNDEIIDGGFEAPVLAANSYAVAPSGTPWQFSNLAGISNNSSGMTLGNPAAPQGAQVAFIMSNSSMSYTDYLDAGSYDLSFLAAQRAKYQTQNQSIEVLVDGTNVGVITPASTTYATYETSSFSVTAGTHTIELLGLSPQSASSAAFIDSVSLASTQSTITDGGFETPVLTAKSYAMAPAGSAWHFSGLSGLSTNQSGFTLGSSNAPDGAQVGFIKDNAAMTQSIYFAAGTYSVSFLAAERANYQTQSQGVAVLIDGTRIGTITPTGVLYLSYQTPNFSVTAGTHTVELLGTTPASADSTIFLDDAAIIVGGGIVNGSFETPVMAAHAYEVAPAGASWQFSGDSGVSANGSAFTAGNPAAPSGNQVAFLKQTASISQSVYLGAGIYDISFLAAQRQNAQTQSESLEILVDGVIVGNVTAASTTYGLYDTSTFSVSAGVHTIEFLGVNPSHGDDTVFIDDVQLNV